MPKMDTYNRWKRDGVLEKNIDEIRRLRSQNFTLVAVAEYLKIASNTLIALKDKYDDVRDAYDKGYGEQLSSLWSALFQKAMGFEKSISDLTYEYKYDENGKLKEKRLVIEKKRGLYFAPDQTSIEFLMSVNHGINRKQEINANIKSEGTYIDTLTKSIEKLNKDKADATTKTQ